MKEYYISALGSYLSCIFYVHIRSKKKCGKMRSEVCFSVRRATLSIIDYAERLSTHFNLEISSNHFGNDRSLSIEGYNIAFLDENHKPQSEFHSHLSDYYQQNASTTHVYVISMLKELEKGNKINRNCTIWKSTDGCSKQYHCGVLLYFISLLLSNFNITIDKIIGAPGHEKDIFDAINDCD